MIAEINPRQRRRNGERGQAAVEFVFGMLLLLAIISVLYQALHFELDVFNKLNELRRTTFRVAHQNQDTTEDAYFGQSIQFTRLGDLKWRGGKKIRVPFQVGVNQNIRYPNKTYRMRKGTKYYEPIHMRILHNQWVFMGIATLSHAEQSKDVFKNTAVIPGTEFLYIDLDDIQDVANYSF